MAIIHHDRDYTLKEAAAILGRSVGTLRTWCRYGAIPCDAPKDLSGRVIAYTLTGYTISQLKSGAMRPQIKLRHKKK